MYQSAASMQRVVSIPGTWYAHPASMLISQSSILTWTCGDTICMPVPFIRSGFNNSGTAGANTGSLGLRRRVESTPRAPFLGLVCSLIVVMTMPELGTMGNGVWRKYGAAIGSSVSVAKKLLSGLLGRDVTVVVCRDGVSPWYSIRKHDVIDGFKWERIVQADSLSYIYYRNMRRYSNQCMQILIPEYIEICDKCLT